MATATISGSAVKVKPVKKKRAKKKKNYYFDQTTEDAIIRYNKSDNPVLRNTIYINKNKKNRKNKNQKKREL